MQVDFQPTAVDGAFVMAGTRFEDERGFLAVALRADELEARGLAARIAQVNVSYNRRRGTIRGLHYQVAPHEEEKIVRCTRGAVFDVVVDLRPASPTYRRWAGTELSADNRLALYIPKGCAHGFQTLTDDTEIHYLVSEYFAPMHYRGVRWNDPAFAIAWPLAPTLLHERDRSYPDFSG